MQMPRLSRLVLALLLTLTVVGPWAGGAPTLAQETGTPAALRGLADARTTVVAQGVAALPSPRAVWSVTRPTADAVVKTAAAERSLGFVVATDAPLLVTDVVTGARQRLSADEATFNAAGASQSVSSLDDDATDYLRIALEPTGVERDAPDDGPVLTSDDFPAPGGDRDLDLLTAVVDGGTSLSLSSSKAPALVYAPDGLRYAVGKAAPRELGEGEAIALTGKITLFAPEEGADAEPVRVFVAVVGAAIPTAEAGVPISTPAPGTAAIVFVVFACPAETINFLPADGDISDPSFLSCTEGGPAVIEKPLVGATVTLTGPNGTTSLVFDVADEPFLGFGDLTPGSYTADVSFGGTSLGYRSACNVVDAGSDGVTGLVGQITAATAVPVSEGQTLRCDVLTQSPTPAPAPGATGTGSLSIDVLTCPASFVDFPGPQPSQADGLATCDGDLDYSETSQLPSVEVVLTEATSGATVTGYSGQDGTVFFADLPVGSYFATVDAGTGPLPYRSGCGALDGTGYNLGLYGSMDPPTGVGVGEGYAVDCTILTRNPSPVAAVELGTVVVAVLRCPDGTNRPTLQGESAYDCGGSPVGPGVTVQVVGASDDGVAETGADGRATVEVAPGDYAIYVPDEPGLAYGICGAAGVGLAGLIDGFSVGAGYETGCGVYLLSPADRDAFQDVDTDGDFLTDAQEARLGTDTAVEDTDGDGTVDGYEVYTGTDPLA